MKEKTHNEETDLSTGAGNANNKNIIKTDMNIKKIERKEKNIINKNSNTMKKESQKKDCIIIVGLIENSTIKTIKKYGREENEGRLDIRVIEPDIEGFEKIAVVVGKEYINYTGMIGTKIKFQIRNRSYFIKNSNTGRIKDFCNEIRAVYIEKLPD